MPGYQRRATARRLMGERLSKLRIFWSIAADVHRPLGVALAKLACRIAASNVRNVLPRGNRCGKLVA